MADVHGMSTPHKTPKPKPAKPPRGVLGITKEGIHVLKQPDSAQITQKRALEIAKELFASRRVG